jgi:hypothetical protein
VIPILAEIISSTPLTIVNERRFLPFLNAVRSKPVKGTSVIEGLEVSKVPSTMFKKDAPVDQITFCIRISTTNGPSFLVPLVK